MAAGFRSPSDAFNRASADIMRFLGEGDSGGVGAHVRLRLDQDLIATRDAFDATLEIENALDQPLNRWRWSSSAVAPAKAPPTRSWCKRPC